MGRIRGDAKRKRGRKFAWPRIRTEVLPSGRKSFRVDAGFRVRLVGGVKERFRDVRRCATIEEAEAEAASLRAERGARRVAEQFDRQNRAVSLTGLSDAQRADVLAALRVLDGTKGSLEGSVRFWKKHAAPANARTCSEVLNELLQSARMANRRERTISELEGKLGAFCGSFGKEQVASITTSDISTWLDKRTGELAPRSRAAYRQSLNRFFSFAARRNYRDGNPVLAIEKPTIEAPPPEVFTPREVMRLLVAAQRTDAAMIPYYALGLFAGLRTENELRGMDWRRIDVAARTIEVTAASAKKRRQRYVDMADNLLEWILPHRRESGPIHYSRLKHRAIVAKARLIWTRNVMRHSFASYHLAAHNDAAKTALALGHPHGVEVLFSHYRKMVRSDVAAKFWKISPKVKKARQAKVKGKILQLRTA